MNTAFNASNPASCDASPRAEGVGVALLPATFAVAAAFFLIGFLNYPLRVIGWDASYLPGDGIDNPLNNFILENGYQSLQGKSSFWHAPMFYPVRGMTASTDPHILDLPLYSVLRAMGLSPERAFQGWFLAAFVLNFVSAAWALRRLGFGPLGIAAGAYLFTFALPVVGQTNHAQLLHRWLVPPAVVFFWEFLQRPNNRKLAVVLTCWLGQLYLTAYIAVFLGELLLTMGVVAAVRYFRSLPWRELLSSHLSVWLGRAALIIACAVVILPLYIRHAMVVGPTPSWFIRELSPTEWSWLTPPPPAAIGWLYDHLGINWHDPQWERWVFPGFLALAALVFGLVQLFRATGPAGLASRPALCGVAAAATALLMIKVTNWGDVLWLHEYVMGLPGERNIRAVGRVILVLLFPMGMLLASMVDNIITLSTKKRPINRYITTCILIVVLILDTWLIQTTHRLQWDYARFPIDPTTRFQSQLIQIINTHSNPQIVYVFSPENPPKELEFPRLQVIVMRAAQDAASSQSMVILGICLHIGIHLRVMRN